MKLNKKTLLFLTAILAVVALLFILSKSTPQPLFPLHKSQTIKIGDSRFTAYTADDVELREKGLSGITALPKGIGMLFIFEHADYYPFWMKDMLVPLDFVFIRDYTVVDTIENVNPDSYPETFVGIEPYDQVLEAAAGEVRRNKIKRGDRVSIEGN